MIDDGNEKRNRQLAFELQNSHVCEKRSNMLSNYIATATSCKNIKMRKWCLLQKQIKQN